jgi:hypothetical protein
MQLTLKTTKAVLGTVELAEASTVDELIAQAAQQHGAHIKTVIAAGKVLTDTSQPLKDIEAVRDGATLLVMLQKSPLPSKHTKAVEQVGARTLRLFHEISAECRRRRQLIHFTVLWYAHPLEPSAPHCAKPTDCAKNPPGRRRCFRVG